MSGSVAAAEREAKSFDGIYIGTVAGSASERATLAFAIQHLIEQFERRVGKTHCYCDIGVSVQVRGGKVAEGTLSCTQTLRPVKAPPTARDVADAEAATMGGYP